jgi:catechol 2,3-dioxygenase-like lactoylglutathione lyase family enzyme
MVQLGAFVLGTPDPAALAAFYRALLGWVTVEGGDPAFVRLRDPERERPGLSFQLEPDHVAPTWPPRPGTQQMQGHLDVLVDDLDAEAALSLGATRDDPPFCLFVPGA